MEFRATNWYWRAEDGRIYSSAGQTIINEKDKNFLAWQEAGYLPMPWPKDSEGKETDAALAAVLAFYGLKLFPPTLEEIKQAYQKQIDDAAENERLKYITNGVGQSMTYQEKYNQAVDYSNKWKAHKETSDKEPNENDYLLLKAGIGIDGDTLIEVAETVTYAYAMWQKIGAAIEATRLETKAKIAETKDADSAQAVFDALKWPEPGK